LLHEVCGEDGGLTEGTIIVWLQGIFQGLSNVLLLMAVTL